MNIKNLPIQSQGFQNRISSAIKRFKEEERYGPWPAPNTPIVTEEYNSPGNVLMSISYYNKPWRVHIENIDPDNPTSPEKFQEILDRMKRLSEKCLDIAMKWFDEDGWEFEVVNQKNPEKSGWGGWYLVFSE